MSDWNSEQGHGERAMREWQGESEKLQATVRDLLAALRAVAMRGCTSPNHLHHPDECPDGDGCLSCPCSAHIAQRAINAHRAPTKETDDADAV